MGLCNNKRLLVHVNQTVAAMHGCVQALFDRLRATMELSERTGKIVTEAARDAGHTGG